ncbi:MAG TPA: GntR family transcriptional regulator [Gemmatimonadaceae bacterium]|nr:GntR family transcriptional regulator [Gemmatimonadaceae bacterium]
MKATRKPWRADLPRYQQIADELVAQIGASVYPVGGLLPTEMELCAHYAASRSTVREALRLVRDAGLISRRRKTGTAVVAQVPPVSYRQPTNAISDLLQYGENTRIETLSERRVICDAPLAGLLECREGHAWLKVTSLRTVPDDPRPICMTTAYVDAGLPDIGQRLGHVTGPISAMLEQVYGIRIARVEQSIQAIRLGRRQAALLRAEPGSPALRAIRRYYQEAGPLIELSSAIHPGDRFTYVTSLVRT